MNVKRYLRNRKRFKTDPLPIVAERTLPLGDIGNISPENYALWQSTTISTGSSFDPKTFDWDHWLEEVKSQTGRYSYDQKTR